MYELTKLSMSWYGVYINTFTSRKSETWQSKHKWKEISLFIFYLVHSLKLTQWITSYFIVYLYTWTSTYIFITKTQYIICQTGEHKTANKTSYVTSHHHRMTVCRLFLHLSHKSFTMSEHSLKKSLETKTCCNKCVSHTLKSFV